MKRAAKPRSAKVNGRWLTTGGRVKFSATLTPEQMDRLEALAVAKQLPFSLMLGQVIMLGADQIERRERALEALAS